MSSLYLLKLLGHNRVSIFFYHVLNMSCSVLLNFMLPFVLCSLQWLILAGHGIDTSCFLCLVSELMPACLSFAFHTPFATDTPIAAICGIYFRSNLALYCAGRLLGAVPAGSSVTHMMVTKAE
jgi:hypothetical protein